MVYGYIRVSTDKQDIASQKLGVERKAAELGVTIDEYVSDDGISGVKEYTERALGGLVERVMDGDIIIVPEMSRLARSVFMLFRIVEQVTQVRGATIYAIKEGQKLQKNDIVSAIIISAYGVAAQIEREMICKRTQEGVDRRKKDGVKFGRPVGSKSKPKGVLYENESAVLELINKGIKNNDIARIFGVHRDTVVKFRKARGLESEYSKNNLPPNKNKKGKMRLFLDSKREEIKKMAADGLQPSHIDKILCVRVGSLRDWYKFEENADVYRVFVEEGNQVRRARNVDCGKQKERYK